MARDTKKIDAKGRFFIPTKFKEAMGEDLVVTTSLDTGYLSVYTAEAFKKVTQQLKGLNSFDPKVRWIKREILGEALEVKVDSQGRIKVSDELWERIGAQSGDEICVLDVDGKLDICTKAFYAEADHDISSIVGLESAYFIEGL